MCAEAAAREGAHLYEQFVFINFDKPFNNPPPHIASEYKIFMKYLEIDTKVYKKN